MNGRLIRTKGLLLLFFLLTVSACTSMVQRKDLPYPLTTDRFADPVKVVTVPLPVIAASFNEGVTYGGLTAFLLHDADDQVDTLIAPQINYNENFGVTGTVYGKFNLSPEREMEFNVSRSTKVNDDLQFMIRDKNLLGKRLELKASLYGFTDGSTRYFGFGPSSPPGKETNFGDREFGFTVSAGYDITDRFQFVLGERLRQVRIVRGAIVSLPYTRDVYNAEEVPGLDGFTTHAQMLALVYNTTDSRETPARGIYAAVTAEGSLEALGSAANFFRYGIEVKGYLPLLESRLITAGRFAYSQVRGSGIPFLELSILGGENTLRGFGRGRFFDTGSILLNVEERIRLARWKLFDVNTDWELTPFLDVGTVTESIGRIEWHAVEFNPGIGFRAVVRPNIVGRIDVGFGKEGATVFVGLRYPF